MKRLFAAVLCLIMVLGMFGCTKPATNDETPAVTAPASDVEMQYITPDEAAALLDNEDYIFFDVRQAVDYQVAHVPGAESHDMHSAKEGDFAAGVATMELAIKNLDKNIILVCYSGKRYAQATTNVLSALGYDMTKVFTLEGGFTAWSEAYPENIEAAE